MIYRKIIHYTSVLILSLGIFSNLFLAATPAHGKNFTVGAGREMVVEGKEIEYDLPYPGILPDHPLYSLKKVRDSFWLFFTRDSLKKAELLHIFADKKIVMARQIAEKGKWDLTVETLDSMTIDSEKLNKAFEDSHKIGSTPQQDFVDEVLLSREKHLEIMEDILIAAPQGTQSHIEELIQRNVDLYNELDTAF